jgi:ribonucleoside-diphosphate reductase alpha chain
MEQIRIPESPLGQIFDREPAPKLTENALRVLEKRYLRKDDRGKVIETPKELFARVAWNLAQAERLYGADDAKVREMALRFYGLMANLEFLPNSPTLMNAGLDLQLLSACFVLPVDDSLVGIFEALKQQALIHQAGGGTGFAFSRLRPKGDLVKSTMGVASGPVSFMRIFDSATQQIKQGGCISTASLLRTTEGLKPLGRLLDAPALGENFTRDQVFDGTGFSHALVAQDNGVAEVYAIETEFGLRLKATYNHAVAVVDAHGEIVWREVRDLQPGDWLVVVKGGHLGIDRPLPPLRPQHANATKIRVPRTMNADLAELLGLYMADGCTSSGGRLIFTVGTIDIEVAERIRVLMDRCFGLASNHVTEGRGGGYLDIQYQSRDLVRWMRSIGSVKPGSPEAFIPAAVLSGSAETARAFLRGLFEGDGHIHSESGYPCLSTTSPRLAEEVQQLLLSLGVVARRTMTTHRSVAKGHHPVHVLTVVDEPSVRTFSEDIGFVGDRKQDRLENGPRPKVNTSDVVPNQREVLRSIYAYVGRGSGPGRTRRGANRRLYRALMHYISDRHPRELPRKRLLRLLRDFPEVASKEHLRQMADPSRVYTRVTAIRLDRVATGDIEVPGAGRFVANGILVHNKRRGANMGILRVDHPDILDFITCKDKTTEITNFNISVAVTDKFMGAVKAGKRYDLVNPRTKQVVGQLDAREVLDKIAYQAWKNGEPGLFFIDENNRRQPTPNVGEMEATNPCGEQPLLPYESCNLGSIDIARHMKRTAGGKWEVDWAKLERTIRTAVRMLDDVIDMNEYPVKQIEEMTKATRKIGLGVMGFARMLFMLEVPYDSREGVEWGRKIMKFIQETGYDESAKLAKERDVYPAWEGSRHEEKGLRLRNSYVTTVAPTGTLSMIADTSGGCEPEFSLIWYKRVMEGEQLPYFLDYFEEVAKREGFWTEDLKERILENRGSPRGLEVIPEKWQRVFGVAYNVSPEWHVRMQAAFQDYCDAATSKTINMPPEATVEDVKKAYLLAYELKCKGITVYREGSREDQVLNVGVPEADKAAPASREVRLEVPAEPVLRPRPRPDVITGRTQKILTGYGALYVTINEDDKGVFEVFAQIGRGGGYTASFTEGLARLVSLCLRSGVPIDEIIDQLEGIRSPRIALDHGERIYSIPDAIAKAIKRHIGAQKAGVQPPVESFDDLGGAAEVVETDVELEKETRDVEAMIRKGLNPECPECGKQLIYEEGCVKCRACGYSEC